MGRKPNNEPIDKEKAKRLKQLRESVFTDTSFIKDRCKLINESGCGVSICDGCEVFETDSLSPKILAKILSGCGTTESSIVSMIENADRRLTPPMESKYKKFFGEELYNKYVVNDALDSFDVFVKSGISKPPYFLYRYREIQTLCEKVKANTVTIVCGDGGIGKTTLVEQFLYEYKNEFNYYQTITVDNKTQGEKPFNVKDNFLSSIKLTVKGEKELSIDVNSAQHFGEKDQNIKWIGDKLGELEKGALFVLDNFTCIGNEIRELERNFPNCKFIVTTRQIESIRSEMVLMLEAFCGEDACSLFELYLGRINNPLNEHEKNIFNTQINSWCCGNAEAIYYVARLIVSSISAVHEYTEIEQWLKFYSGLEKDLTGEGTLAEKLAALLRMDAELMAGLNDDEERSNNVFKLLAVLSITEMNEIPVKSLIEFLEENKEFTREIKRLENKGLLKINNNTQCIKMHPLICHALELNNIEKCYTEDVKMFAFLITGDTVIKNKFKLKELERINIPKGIIHIGPFIFEDIDMLEKISLYTANSEEKEAAKLNAYDNAKEIEINFPDSLTEIDFCAFRGSRVKTLRLPKNLEKIGVASFLGCCNIEELILPDLLKEISRLAFSECYLLKKVILSRQIEKLSSCVFSSCTSLEEIIIPSNVKVVGNGAFMDCRSLKKVILEDGIEYIGQGAFYECDSLEEVNIPESIKEIKSSAFCSCDNLKKVNLGKVKRICDGAFRDCKSLKSIMIPASVKEIQRGAFSGCTALENIFVEEGSIFQVKDGNLYSVEGEPIISLSTKEKTEIEDLWIYEQGNLADVLLNHEEINKIQLIGNKGVGEFKVIFVKKEADAIYCILRLNHLTEGLENEGNVYKVETYNIKINNTMHEDIYCLRKEWDKNICLKIFRYYDIAKVKENYK